MILLVFVKHFHFLVVEIQPEQINHLFANGFSPGVPERGSHELCAFSQLNRPKSFTDGGQGQSSHDTDDQQHKEDFHQGKAAGSPAGR